jgi:2-C-methyl-D-erythritol 4-phosphate cytidylyltransferase
MTQSAVIVLGAGSGTRVGAGRNKVFLDLAGMPLITWSVRTVLAVPEVKHVVVTHHPAEADIMASCLLPLLKDAKFVGERSVRLVPGGASRTESEWYGLRALETEIDTGEVQVVAIHDGARPLASAALFQQVLSDAAQFGAAAPACSMYGLIDLASNTALGRVAAMQTPQAAKAKQLYRAYHKASAQGSVDTDTIAILGAFSELQARLVPGEFTNLKVTWQPDLALIEQFALSQLDGA